MDREDLEWLAAQAMDNIHDMDTTTRDFARAAVNALGWRRIDENNLPDDGDTVILTDGEARWMDRYYQSLGGSWRAWTDTKERVATHWHPLHDLPAALSPAQKGEA